MAGVALASCAPQPTAAPPAPPAGEAEATTAPAAEATEAPAVEAPTQAPSAEKVELRWLDWSGQDDAVNEAVAAFAERYPNVTINFEPIGDAWGEKQLTQMVSGTAPDILTGYDQTSYLWAEKGQLLDLNPLVDADLTQSQIDDFFEHHWEGLVHPDSGIRMGMPYYTWFYQWYYNKEAFDEAGVAYPNDDWTVDDYSDALEALTVRDADGNVTRWGGVEQCYETFRIQVWLRIFGGHLVDPSDRTVCALSSEESKAALEWHRARTWDTNTLAQSLQIVSPGAYMGMDPLATGKVAIMGQGSGDIITLLQDPPGFEWGVAVPPAGPDGTRAGLSTIDNWGIWKGTSSPDMAWEFLKMLSVEDEFQMAVSALWGGVPNRKSLLEGFEDMILAQYPDTAKPEHIEPQVRQLLGGYIKVGEQFKRTKESAELIEPVLQQIFTVGDVDVSVVDDVCADVTAINQA